MKKLDIPLVEYEDGRVGMVINHTKHKDYLHVVEVFESGLSSLTFSWRTSECKPWNGDIIISNHKNRIV